MILPEYKWHISYHSDATPLGKHFVSFFETSRAQAGKDIDQCFKILLIKLRESNLYIGVYLDAHRF